ncbi:TPA: amino acid permease [Escherichia coli]|nr:amino acid permease [Escherichia coli]
MGSETKTTEAPGLRRELKARHLTMIAIGGSIGTGLFVASGATISQAGPGGALLSYMLIGLMVYFLMTSLGELAAYMPVSGSFATYGQNYVEEGFGFALGWNYWYNWAVTIAVDLVAAQLVMSWWFPDTPGWIWSALFLGVAMIVGFSFQGTELIGIAAGESEDPAKNIPRAVRQVFWRILLFYVFAILIISLIIPYTDPSLLRNDVKDISVSPFTLVFQHAGLLSAAAVMNAVILTAVLSAGNSGMYASTRMLYTLACDGKAPRIFAKLSRGGVPRNALYATTVIAGLCFLTSMFGNQTVYLWLLNTSGMTGFIAWLGIAISHYRFRRGYVLQGHDINDLPYRSGFFPLGPIFAFILCLIITLGQNYEAFLKDTIDWGGVAATYIGIPLFLIIWFGYKLIKGTHFVRYSEMKFPQNDKK